MIIFDYRKDRYRNALLVAALVMLSSASSAFAVAWDWNANAMPQHDKSIKRAQDAYVEGDIEGALIILNQCKGQSQDDCRIRHILVEIYNEHKRYPEARSEMSEMIAVEQRLNRVTATARPMWADVPQAKLELATIFENEGDYFSAIRVYQEAQALADVERQKDWMQPRLGIAHCHEAQKEWAQAKQAYESATKDPYMTASTKTYIQEKIAEMDQRISGGSDVATAAGGSHPTGTQKAGGGGSITTASSPGNFPKTSFGNVPLATPAQRSSPPVNRPVAVQQALQEIDLKHYDSASTILANYLARNKTNGEAHYLLAVTYAFQKKYAEAAKEYESAIEFANNLQLQRKASDGLRKIQPKQ
jgi:tetratricopeptide (TPR) repeat protein